MVEGPQSFWDQIGADRAEPRDAQRRTRSEWSHPGDDSDPAGTGVCG